jgi:glutaredoxin
MSGNSDEKPVSSEVGNKPARRFNGAYIFLIIFAALLVFNYRGPVDTIDCTPEVIATEPDVIMLGAWWCTYCYQAKRYFQNKQINYCEYDMENHPTGIELYEKTGGGAIPVLMIGEHVLRGFSEQQIEAALALLRQDNKAD